MIKLDADSETPHPWKRYLYRKLFSVRARAHFGAQYIDDVDPNGFQEARAINKLTEGADRAWIMPEGVAVLRCQDAAGVTWSAYETLERAETAKQWSSFAAFARGRWQRACPHEPGLYPVVARSVAVPSSTPFAVHTEYAFRRLQLVEGAVRDVTEYTPATHRTLWQGWWWSEALPLLLAPTAD